MTFGINPVHSFTHGRFSCSALNYLCHIVPQAGAQPHAALLPEGRTPGLLLARRCARLELTEGRRPGPSLGEVTVQLRQGRRSGTGRGQGRYSGTGRGQRRRSDTGRGQGRRSHTRRGQGRRSGTGRGQGSAVSARGPKAAILSGSEESSRRASAHSSKAEKHLVATAGKVGRAFPCPGDLGPSALCVCLVSAWSMQALTCKWGWDTGKTKPRAEALNSRLTRELQDQQPRPRWP